MVALSVGSARASTSELHEGWRALERERAAPAAFVTLAFDQCNAMVFAIANRITCSRWEAEDVTQAVFENLLNRLPKIRDPDAIPGFLRTCAVRMSLRQVRRSRWRRQRLDQAVVPDLPGADDDPAGLATLVRQLLARLDPDERAAVVLKYVELHSHEEVAELMGVSVSTARRRLEAGRAKLAAVLGEDRLRVTLGEKGASHD